MIGERVKQYRINAGLTQQDLENKSGVSVRSISRLEQGASVQFESLIKILFALNLESNIDLLIPDQTKRPSFYLKDNDFLEIYKSNKFMEYDDEISEYDFSRDDEYYGWKHK